MRRIGERRTALPVTPPAIDLGDEPALVTSENRHGPPDRRAVSIRWLAGTILTGFTAVLLMGGALFAALDGRHRLATPPAIGVAAARGEVEKTPVGRKGDRIRAVATAISNRQILHVSTVKRIGEKDFIKVRPFARIIASLFTRRTGDAAKIPPFNPLKIFSDAADAKLPELNASDAIYTAEVDGEVLVEFKDFPLDSPLIDADIALSAEEVEDIVRTSARFLSAGTVHTAALSYVDPKRFEFRPGTTPDLAVRIIPENVTRITKSDEAGRAVYGLEEKIVTIRNGDTFRALLLDNGATEEEAEDAVQALTPAYDAGQLREGQKLRLALGLADDGSDRLRPIRVSLYSGLTHEATIALADQGHFVAAPEPVLSDNYRDRFAKSEPGFTSGPRTRIYEAIYETAFAYDVPRPLIDELIRIYSFDLDFKRRTARGDSLEIFHSLPDDESPDAQPEILYTAITVGGVKRRFYRFRTPDDGVVDYYDETGRSAKKFLLRKPVARGRFRSPFGMRRHPILKYTRMHKGVDWSAPRGTPIMAAGNGVVVEAKWKSGYGRWIRIRHANGYETGYAHQNGFAPGIKPGVRVRQGQVIGYVGSSGLSTGPHLHFEVKVNNRYVDPMRIRLPRGRVLKGEMLAAFEAERDRIDMLMNRSPASTRLAATGAR